MWQKHGGGLATPGFDRLNLYIVLQAVHIHHYLGCLPDAIQRCAGVPVRVKSKPGDRIQFKEEGANHPEKIAYHGVGGPGVEQITQAVAHIECAAPMFFYQAPYSTGESFKAIQSIDVFGVDVGVCGHQRRMLDKTQINDTAPGGRRRLNKWSNESAIVVQIVDSPDHIIANSQAVKNVIQPREAGGNPVAIL